MLRLEKGYMRYIRVRRHRFSHTLSSNQRHNRRTRELPLLKATPTSCRLRHHHRPHSCRRDRKATATSTIPYFLVPTGPIPP
jgi:hypothetical protein